MSYAELHCLTNFSFLRGASHPEELVAQAHELGYAALAITDECSLAGVVRAHVEAKKWDLRLIIGSEFQLDDGLRFVLLATDLDEDGRLDLDCRLQHVSLHEIGEQSQALARRLDAHQFVEQDQPIELRAAGALQDTLTAIRLKGSVSEMGHALFPNGERYLRPLATLERLYPPSLRAETLIIAARCAFSLDELRYEYPEEIVPKGETLTSYLRRLTEEGFVRRFPPETTTEAQRAKVRKLIEHELEIIAEAKYEAFFLTVRDVVEFARSKQILCQGRGSAANSAVCYCLGITAVDPSRMEMLFERFEDRFVQLGKVLANEGIEHGLLDRCVHR